VPLSEDVRRETIEKALESLPPESETWRVPWRGNMEKMPVIRIALDSVVLNPTSHRIKSQLESASEARKAIAEDPEGEAAQEAIAKLLRETLRFGELKQNLDDDEQREPGIVTRQGRLINGNTRAVALRELGEEHVDVAVLPADASLGEIYDLELDLQVAQDYRQDYSFTNELLFVEDLITQEGRNEEEVALRLRWASPTKKSSLKKGSEKVRRYVRHLSLIREIQEMSGGQVPLTDFDEAEQAMQELDKAFEAMRDKDPPAAQRLKAARTLGLLVDLGYSRQRVVDSGWVEDYLKEAIIEDMVLNDVLEAVAGGAAEADETDPGDGLGEFEVTPEEGGEDPPVHALVQLLSERLSSTSGEEKIKLPTSEGEKDFDREGIRESIEEAMRSAAEDAQRAAKAGNELQLPVHLASESARQLSKARQAYEEVAGRDGFHLDELRAEVEKARRALDALEQRIES
jgi:ribosomal protein L13E